MKNSAKGDRISFTSQEWNLLSHATHYIMGKLVYNYYKKIKKFCFFQI